MSFSDTADSGYARSSRISKIEISDSGHLFLIWLVAGRIRYNPAPCRSPRQRLAIFADGVDPATLDSVQAVTTPAELLAARSLVDATMVSEGVIGYVVALVRRTRELPSVALGAVGD